MKVRFREEAVQDLSRIRAWYETRNQAVSRSMLRRVRERISELTAFPEMAPLVPGRQERVLTIAGTPLIAVYRIENDEVDIIAVLDARRDPAERFRR